MDTNENIIWILSDNGWTPEDAGTWDSINRKATISKEENRTIVITASSLTLEGIGKDEGKYKIDGSVNNILAGIIIEGKENITLSNFDISGCATAIEIKDSNFININNNNISNNKEKGIYLDSCRVCSIAENIIKNNETNIYLNLNNKGNKITRNEISSGSNGIVLNKYNNYNLFYKNTITKENNGAKYCGVISIEANSYNEIDTNTISISKNKTIEEYVEYFGISLSGGSYNKIIDNNIEVINNENTSNGLDSLYYGVYITGNLTAKNDVLCNKIIIKNNNFITLEGEINSIIAGVWFSSYDSSSNKCTKNYILIEEISIATSEDSKSHITNIVKGIGFSDRNSSNFINENTVVIKEFNIFDNKNISSDISGIYISKYNRDIVIEDNDIKIEENVIDENSNNHGIYLGENNYANSILGNKIYIFNNESRLNYGIFLYENNNDNQIGNNKIGNNNGVGIYLLKNNDNNNFSENLVYGDIIEGIYLVMTNNSNIIFNNKLCNNNCNGIVLERGNSANDIIDNDCEWVLICDGEEKKRININDSNFSNVLKDNKI